MLIDYFCFYLIMTKNRPISGGQRIVGLALLGFFGLAIYCLVFVVNWKGGG
jgi:hypothetical protein